MNLTHLYNEQLKLDQRIYEEKGITPSQEITDKKLIALKVEIGEMLNETRVFKYWSEKEPAPREVILEELVDVLHFLLSIGLDRNYHKFVPDASGENYKQFTILQLAFDLFENPIDCSSSYSIALNTLMGIGYRLGFTEEEIKAAYFRKNLINHKRQEESY